MSFGVDDSTQSRPLKVAVLCNLDGFANSGKPLLIEEVLSQRGHTVTVLDTSFLSRASDKRPLRVFPSPAPTRLKLYLAGALAHILERFPRRLAGTLTAALYVRQMRLRGAILAREMARISPDVVVCETQMDSGVMLMDLGRIKKIYNCATPLAEELYFGGNLSDKGYERLRAYELSTYEAADYLSFHWHCYAEYVRKHYQYSVDNIFTFDRNAVISKTLAGYSEEPRVVYLGYLGGYWIDPELLSQLTKMYPRIDVYGLPRPPRRLGLNYRGYATREVLQNYQFGLITCTKDRLRREGFSAKHVDYLAAGLPVLVPEWRTATQDLRGTVTYSADDFLDQLREYSKEEIWNVLSKEALEQAEELSAEKVSAQFISIVEGD